MKAPFGMRADDGGEIDTAGGSDVAGRADGHRFSAPGLAAVAAAAFAYAAYHFVATDRGLALACFGVALASLLVAAREPSRTARHGPLLAVLMALPAIAGVAAPWPYSRIAPFALYALLARVVPSLRSSAPPLRRGAFGPAVLGWIAAIMAVSALALVLWVQWIRPDLSQMQDLLPPISLPLLLLGGLGFALFNALLEEAVYRLVFLGSLDAVTPSGWIAVLIQAAAFGLSHLRGFPGGAVGVTLATLYGVMLGALRRRAGGLLAPYVAHVVADFTIFVLLLSWSR
ncbi:type II CAAX endopeptidase family protein [Sorangium sp. So ce726]|uniref:CPBP family intramembrane glutamic endopeptidase n=1 Tax=Sorangium sp. So ce726 TaxID=3133319 RepID=UPI003F63BEAE